PRGGDTLSSEASGLLEVTGEIDIAIGIEHESVPFIVLTTTRRCYPNDLALWIQLQEKDVIIATGENTFAAENGVLAEMYSYVGVPFRIDRDRPTVIVPGTAVGCGPGDRQRLSRPARGEASQE